MIPESMAVVAVDRTYDWSWIIAVICRLHAEGKLTETERDNLLRDILDNT